MTAHSYACGIHEHCGSILSIGAAPGGFRADFEAGALPTRQTTLADVLVDPYMGGNLDASGLSPWELQDAGGRKQIFIGCF